MRTLMICRSLPSPPPRSGHRRSLSLFRFHSVSFSLSLSLFLSVSQVTTTTASVKRQRSWRAAWSRLACSMATAAYVAEISLKELRLTELQQQTGLSAHLHLVDVFDATYDSALVVAATLAGAVGP